MYQNPFNQLSYQPYFHPLALLNSCNGAIERSTLKSFSPLLTSVGHFIVFFSASIITLSPVRFFSSEMFQITYLLQVFLSFVDHIIFSFDKSSLAEKLLCFYLRFLSVMLSTLKLNLLFHSKNNRFIICSVC